MENSEILTSYICEYESKEDRVKAIEAERNLVFSGQSLILPEHLRAVQVLNLPSANSRVYIYNSKYWFVLEPELNRLETKYRLLEKLPKDAGQSNKKGGEENERE